jgi:DNA-directed RNA polymerase specialized sigma24 family protein
MSSNAQIEALHMPAGLRAVHLAEARERLPAQDCDVVVLRHVEQVSLAEMARRTKRTADSVPIVWALQSICQEPVLEVLRSNRRW